MSIDVNVQNDLVIVTESSEDITVNVSNAAGPAGVGVPTGGATGQVLKKLSNTNYDTYWALDGGGVPYSGATGDVNLGEFQLRAGQLTLDTSPTGTAAVGTTRWNDTIGSSETTLKGGSVILKNGVDLVARVVNKVSPNTTLTKAAYQAVRVSGAQGQRLAVAYAQANNDANSADTIGLVCETIATNQEGFIITVGQLENINTTGSLQGETWADGDVLYLSPFTPGAITKVKPTGNGHIVVIGYVEYAHANNGKIYVKVMNGWELDELHDVSIVTPANNEALIYESSTQLWKNKTIATALGYTPISGTGVSGQVAYWNGTNSQTGSNNLFWNSTNNNLGIGSNNVNSGFKLGVSGDVVVSGGSPFVAFNTATSSGSTPAYIQFINSTSIFNIVSTGAIDFYSNANNRMRLFATSGNLSIGGGSTPTDGGQRLQVYGDAFIKGSGNTGASNALSIQNSDGTALFQVTNGQIVLFNTARTISGAMLLQSSGGGNTTGFTFGLLNPFTATSGSTYLITNASSFEPTSGTGTYTFLSARPTINQTGGANGITRGIHVQPTITAAADWRSIEWSNNSGWGLYGDGSASNFLRGALGIGTTSLSAANLSIGKSITQNNQFGVYNFGQLASSVNTTGGFANALVTAASTTFTNYSHYISVEGTIGGSTTLTNNYGFHVTSLAVGTNIYGFYGNIINAANRWNLYMAGTADNYLRGKLLINTTTVGTFDLDVNGTARVSGKLTVLAGSGITCTGSSFFEVFDLYGTRSLMAGGEPSGGIVVGNSSLGSGTGRWVTIVQNGGSSATGGMRFYTDNALTTQVGNFGILANQFRLQVTSTDITTQLALMADASNLYLGYFTYSTLPSSASLAIQSTTKGFLPPRMTTTQKNAIATPAAGLQVYDTTLNQMSYYNGTTWVNF